MTRRTKEHLFGLLVLLCIAGTVACAVMVECGGYVGRAVGVECNFPAG